MCNDTHECPRQHKQNWFFLFINHDLGHSFKTKPVSCLLIWNRWRKLTVSCREFEYIVCWREGRKLQEVEIDGCIKQLTEETGSWIANYRKLNCKLQEVELLRTIDSKKETASERGRSEDINFCEKLFRKK